MENPYAAPQSEILTPVGNQAPLTWKQILFSFDGRIPRRTFWGFSILLTIINLAIGFVCGLLFGMQAVWIASLIGLPMYWPAFAISAKRWHDRDKSAWWNLLQGVIAVGSMATAFSGQTPSFALTGISGICGLWIFVALGCMRGTVGPNKYGEDPT